MKCSFRNCKKEFLGQFYLVEMANHYENDHNLVVSRKVENGVLVSFTLTQKRCKVCGETCICEKCKDELKCCPCNWEKE